MVVDSECKEFVTACIFSFFFLVAGGAGVLEHPVFLNNNSNFFCFLYLFVECV